jgi:hypothetical protein
VHATAAPAHCNGSAWATTETPVRWPMMRGRGRERRRDEGNLGGGWLCDSLGSCEMPPPLLPHSHTHRCLLKSNTSLNPTDLYLCPRHICRFKRTVVHRRRGGEEGLAGGSSRFRSNHLRTPLSLEIWPLKLYVSLIHRVNRELRGTGGHHGEKKGWPHGST